MLWLPMRRLLTTSCSRKTFKIVLILNILWHCSRISDSWSRQMVGLKSRCVSFKYFNIKVNAWSLNGSEQVIVETIKNVLNKFSWRWKKIMPWSSQQRKHHLLHLFVQPVWTSYQQLKVQNTTASLRYTAITKANSSTMESTK